MAIVQTDSQNITNVKTGVLNDNRSDGGRVKRKHATVAIDTTDDAGSTYRVFRIPSDAILERMFVQSTGITGCTGEDWGLYDIDDGAVVSVDLLVDGLTIATANLGGAARISNGNGFEIDDHTRTLWERLGLSSDPHKQYDIVLTLNNNAGSSGTVGCSVTYSDG